MDERGIIIADRDAKYRDQVADHFRKAGYRVETTDSAVHVLCSILEKQTPVLLLGSDFDNKVSSIDLIHLLKKCNRRLHVIMVSDEMPLAQARKVRQEGIFHRVLKPAAAGDTEELGVAVDCAFRMSRTGGQLRREQAPRSRPAVTEGAAPKVEPHSRPLKAALSWVTGLGVLIFGTSYLSPAAAERVNAGSSSALWIFLGFCALIVATQLLPIFRIKLPDRTAEADPAKNEAAADRK